MVSPDWNEKDQRLLERTRELLRTERAERTDAQREAFTARVMEQVAGSSGRSAPEPGKPRRSSSSKRKYIYLAAAVFTGILGAVAMMTDMLTGQVSDRELRLKAEKIPVLKGTLTIGNTGMFAGLESQTLVLITYDHHGERCLWLYPEQLIRWGEDPEADEEFARRKKWRATVVNGRIEIPRDALAEAFEPGEELVLLQVHRHFEIWTAASLNRYFAKSAGKI